jgi:hypothetical protein
VKYKSNLRSRLEVKIRAVYFAFKATYRLRIEELSKNMQRQISPVLEHRGRLASLLVGKDVLLEVRHPYLGTCIGAVERSTMHVQCLRQLSD